MQTRASATCDVDGTLKSKKKLTDSTRESASVTCDDEQGDPVCSSDSRGILRQQDPVSHPTQVRVEEDSGKMKLNGVGK